MREESINRLFWLVKILSWAFLLKKIQ